MTTVPILTHIINSHIKYAPICDLELPLFLHSRVCLYMTVVHFCPSDETDKKYGLGLLPTDVVNNCSHSSSTTKEFDLMTLVSEDQTKVINNFPSERYGDDIARIATTRLANTVVEKMLKVFPMHDVIERVKSAPYLSATVLDSLCEKEAEKRYWNVHATRIQRMWRHAIASPYHVIGRRRLLREFTGLEAIVVY